MKKLLLIVVIVLASVSQSFASDRYEGVWLVNVPGQEVIVSLHRTGNTLVGFTLNRATATFETGMGELNGNKAVMKSVNYYSTVQTSFEIKFTSDNTFTATQKSCNQIYTGWFCLLPNGTKLEAIRIF